MDMVDLTTWARGEAQELRKDVNSSDPQRSPAAGIDFLRRHAQGTAFYEEARQAGANPDNWVRMREGVAAALESWALFVQTGLAAEPPIEVRIRTEAANDIMEQVQRLLDDRDTHPAAAIVLCGAALEEFLRSLFIGCTEPLVGRPSLSTYATALRKAGLLSATDAKDITAWAALRNEAAHGHFEDLSRERAKVQFEAINLFMRQKSSS